jgi:hypothetical protein
MRQAEQATQDDAECFARRGFSQRIGFGERPALIIIDMVKGVYRSGRIARGSSR